MTTFHYLSNRTWLATISFHLTHLSNPIPSTTNFTHKQHNYHLTTRPLGPMHLLAQATNNSFSMFSLHCIMGLEYYNLSSAHSPRRWPWWYVQPFSSSFPRIQPRCHPRMGPTPGKIPSPPKPTPHRLSRLHATLSCAHKSRECALHTQRGSVKPTNAHSQAKRTRIGLQ